MASNVERVGVRYRGMSSGMPPVDQFRSGYMLTRMNVTSAIDSLSESDMDTNSDSENECYGGRYSLEASPQDDKVSNGGGVKNNAFLNGGRGRGFAAAYRGFGNDESSNSVSSSEVNSASTVSNYGNLLERKLKAGPDFYGINGRKNETLKQGISNVPWKEKLDTDIPSAPPLANSPSQVNLVSGKLRVTANNPFSAKSVASETETQSNTCISENIDATATNTMKISARTATASSSHPLPARYPTYHASGLGYWYSVLSYDACVRLCLHSWARECTEASAFLENECALLRDAFGLKHILLQSEEELLKNVSTGLVSEGAYVKNKKSLGKIKIQVRKVKMGLEPPTGCAFSTIKSSSMVKLETIQLRLSNVKSIVSSERRSLRRDRLSPMVTVNGSLLHKSLAYMIVGTQRVAKEVPEVIKISFNAWRSTSSSYEVVQELYSCSLRLKSSPEDDVVRMQPGSGETRIFLPDGLGDELIIEINDSKGKYCGHAVVQVADIADESVEKLRSCFIYREPEHEQIGKIQLCVNYSTTPDENSHKCGSVAETIAYDCVLETAMKVQQFQQRNLLLHDSWKWLVTKFASYYGVSDAYTKLRYLSYVMDVATPTADCLSLVNDLLLPLVIKGKTKQTLSHQEVRIKGEVIEELEQILTLVFENYKSLDEATPSGIMDVFGPATGLAAPALAPALKLFKNLNDIFSPEIQLKLCRYFQNATKKRSRRHLAETDEFISNNNEDILMDPLALSTAYKKMKTLCLNIRNEILTDIEIQKHDILPSFIDLPNLSSSIYSTELYSRLRAFLISCHPSGPTPPVVELVIATADFQRDLSLWSISYIKGGIDAKELFHSYITRWIQDKRLALLELCKIDKVKSLNHPSQHPTTPFIDDIYNRLKETLTEYDVIIRRWPEYTFTLENAIADVEKAVVESLEKQYAEVLAPLKESTMPMKFGLKYVQKIAKGNLPLYNISIELGVLLNSMKRMLNTLQPQIESQVKLWGSCIPESGTIGESLSEVTVMIRSKFRFYVQSVIDKLVENTKLHSATMLRKIIQDAKGNLTESDLRCRMQPLQELLLNTIDQLHSVLDMQVFVIACRGFWDGMGQDVLKFLQDRKENRSCYKGSRVAVIVLSDTFASQMQQLLGNALQEKDLEPPRSIRDVQSMLGKDTINHREENYY